ncbi:barstar family protein [Actinacidiphila sp. ITFR-21]|uniref:barstar family protein n=1 Tax=Actinacidiphila sp. ITFR-21 TaxID=3075199 RepID=UPI00288964E7|nr:barstar family protein [Streptomyces sp. ITFR-21]WNI14620.1 barstar family protein [Streptomyces sp. ITFR-21]
MLVLDLAGVGDRQSFMDRCSADLHLPDWFGRNWDALADCLTDLSWWPPETGHRQLRLRNWENYASSMPREWRIVKEVLRDAEIFWRDTDTELSVVLEGGEEGVSGSPG